MALTLEDLASQVAEVTVVWAGNDLHVEYNPNVLTPSLTRELRRKTNADTEADPDASTSEVIGILTKMLVRWDLYATAKDEQAGRALEITVENLERLPGLMLARILKAIVEAATQDPEGHAGASDGGSGAPTSLTNRRR